MGTETAQTVKEIEEARERITHNIRELEGRIPSSAQVAQRAGRVALGGGVGGTFVYFVVRRMRKRRAAKVTQKMTPQVNTVVQLLPEGWARALMDGRARAWAGGLISAMLLLELAELRRLRSINKALTAGR